MAKARENAGPSLVGWTPCSNGHDKYYQEFDFTTLVRYRQGESNGQDAGDSRFAQELVEKERKRQVGALQIYSQEQREKDLTATLQQHEVVAVKALASATQNIIVNKSPARMAHHVETLAPALLRDLPLDVHVLLMESIPDFSSLNNLLISFPRMVRIFKGFQRQIFTGVLRSSGLSLQLQKIITAIMALREQHPSTPCPTELFFDMYLDRKDQPIDMMKFANPVGMLRYIARVMDGTNACVESFVQTRILLHDKTTFPLSDAESCRVHRAFWRFQLCYELTHPGGPAGVEHNAEPPERWSRRYVGHEDGIPVTRSAKGWLSCRERRQAPLLTEFLQTLHPWEVEELKVARYHLMSNVNAFQYNRIAGTPDDLRKQNSLMQRLLMDLDNWNEDSENPTDHLLVADLRVSPRNLALCHEPIWLDNPLEAGSVNAKPKDLNGLIDARAQWGWCMWDAPRLQESGFLKTEYCRFERFVRHMIEMPVFLNAQFSPLDDELAARFRRDLRRELRANELARHTRRKEWLMNWVSTRDPALYQEWCDACSGPLFDEQRAETCYLRAMTLKRHEDAAIRSHPRP